MCKARQVSGLCLYKTMKNALTIPILSGLLLAACVCKEPPTPETGKCYAPDSSFRYYPTEILISPYNNLYTNWKLVSSSGGITGNGEEARFDHLVFKPVGRYEVISNNQVAEYGKIQILSETTTSPLRIRFVSDSASAQILSDMEKEVILNEDKLELQAPCCDRISYQLQKITATH
jgi:hypothetical protein